MIGLVRRIVSPSSSSMRRSTPWVLGCCGPMLMIIVWSSDGPSPTRSAASASDMRSVAPSSRSSSSALADCRSVISWEPSWVSIPAVDGAAPEALARSLMSARP